MRLKACFGITILLTGLLFIQKWKADSANSQINFTVKGPFGTVHGKFTGLKADLKFDPKDPGNSSISASIDAKTVSTGIALRNRDLRKKEEWLDTDKYPLITFYSKKIEKKGNEYTATGDLTLKGQTRSVEIRFTFTGKGSSGVFKGKFTINRQDFHIGKEGGSVGSTITINLNIPVKK
ncbi:MAG: YceI family protein [Chitinophagaceae bacterium]|nr:YceI family protein [Chitinophagaceae bacterium]